MKFWVFILGIALIAGGLSAQEPTEKRAEKRYQTKILKPFASAVPWQRNLAKAQILAKQKKRLIFAYFTRSYSP